MAPQNPTVIESPGLAIKTSLRSSLGDALLMLPFLCLFYVQLVHHRMWRDEINAWGMACASPTISALLANVHYEGHPALWYLLLYGGSKLTHAVWMMKIIQGLIGTGIYLMLSMSTPFRRSEQVLIYTSYFVFFEYTVMSRMYGLLLLFALAYVRSRMRHPERILRNTLWLGLMANVDVTGVLLSAGLLFEYLVERYRHGRENGTTRLSEMVRAVCVYVVMTAISVETMWPAKDISWRTTGRSFARLSNIRDLWEAVVSWLVLPWFPEHPLFPRRFWDVRPNVHYVLWLPVVLPIFYLIFRKHPRLMSMLAVIAMSGMALSHLVYAGSLRHFGIMYIAFLVALWMLRYEKVKVSVLTYVLLALCALGGLTTAYGQWARPFADDYAAAQWIRQNHFEDAALIGIPDTNTIGVAELLNRPIYQLDCACVDTYLKFSNRRDTFDPESQVSERLIGAVSELHAPEMIFLINRPLKSEEEDELAAGKIGASLLAQFKSGEVIDEHFFLYRVSMMPNL